MTLSRCAACFRLSYLAGLWACFHLACLGCMLGMPADRLSCSHMLLVPADSRPGVYTKAPALHT